MPRFTLSWAQQECARCGEIRIRGLTCPVCGSPPDEREADPAAQRRQAVARAIELRLNVHEQRAAVSIPIDLDLLRKEVLGWLDGFFEALAAATDRKFRENFRLWRSVESLLWLDALCSASQPLRPLLRERTLLSNIIREFIEMVREYVTALASATPREAGKASERAQEHLSSAGVESQTLADHLQRFNTLAEQGNQREAFDLVLREAMEVTGAIDVLALDAAGQEFLRSVGVHDLAAGTGIAAMLAAREAEYLFDEDRYWSVVAQTVALMEQNPQRTQGLVRDPVWIDDLRKAAQQQLDARVVYGAALARARRTRHQVRALLDIALVIFEGPAKTYICTLLALKGVSGYGSLRRRDAGGLVNLAGQHGLQPLIEGISTSIRRARAHEDFDLIDDRVLMGEGPGQEETQLEQLLNVVLMGVESVTSVGVAILLLAAHLDLPEVIEDAVSSAELEWTDWVHLVARLAGWEDIEVEVTGGELVVRGNPRGRAADLRTVAMLLPYLPGSCVRASFHWSDEQGAHVFAGPLDPMHRWRGEEQERVKSDFFVHSQRTWTLDEAPLISQDQVRKWIAVNLAQLTEALGDLVQRGRELRNLSKALDDVEAIDTIDGFVGAARGRELGLGPTPQESTAATLLAAWLRLPAI